MFRLLHAPLMILIIALIVFSMPVTAEVDADQLVVAEAGVKQILTLDDGSTLVGRITEVGDTDFKFQSDLGEMTIAKSRVVRIETASESDFRDGEYWYPNPNQTRMLFGPTGKMLKKGAGYFSDIMIFFPGFAYGVTENITIGGGMSIFPGVDAGKQIFFITPKIGLNVLEKVDVAANLMLIRVPIDDDDIDDVKDANKLLPPNQRVEVDVAETVGVLFFTGTYGNENSYATFGAGFGMVDGDLSDNPALVFGLEHRISRRMSFVSENWIFPEVNEPMVSGGIRFFGEKIAVDLAIFTVFDDDVPAIPYIDFVYNF